MAASPTPIEHCRGIQEPLFALTFDDGPSDWTDAILDRMASQRARATFFVIGSAIRGTAREETLRRIVAEGGELGTHTFLHLPLAALSVEDIRDELQRTSIEIERVTGAAPRYWRAPYLQSTAEVAATAAQLGLREIRASLVAADYAWSADETTQFVLERLEPGDIVDLHDGRPPFESDAMSTPTRRETVLAVEKVLHEAARRQLRAVTVTELLAGVLNTASPAQRKTRAP
ncbi:MAG: polysaccharide deacetylase family protein [Chloroflexota bacterium]|nr:polysaccharide deacetylase family protein [Chloroflexota bacterium]